MHHTSQKARHRNICMNKTRIIHAIMCVCILYELEETSVAIKSSSSLPRSLVVSERIEPIGTQGICYKNLKGCGIRFYRDDWSKIVLHVFQLLSNLTPKGFHFHNLEHFFFCLKKLYTSKKNYKKSFRAIDFTFTLGEFNLNSSGTYY